MAREQYNAKILGELLYKKVASSRVLLVGAGGIGCELLKNLVMSGFPSIEVIDLDTIDMTNLNRQFLFQKQHVKQSKAHVARESALKFNPNTKIVSHQANIMDPQFNVSWFAEFTIVFNALDNLEARRHVNQMCLAAGVPLVESGTEGYEGQAYVIKKGLTECFDCYPKPTRTTYPVCTIRSTPSAPIHCIVWAKSYLFSQLFGDSEGEQDMKQDATDDNKELAALARETEELKSIKAAMGTPEYAKKVFEKVFTTDIERLLSMEEMWKTRTKPTPLDYDTLEKSPQSEKELEENDALKDQKVWSIEESFRVFQKSVEQLSDRLKAAQKERADAVLTFDKDDDDAMDFVTATANLRAHIFGIPLKSRFQVKSMAGNIIPAIATTNAVIAGLAVMQGFALLRGNVTNYKRTYLKTVSRQPPLLMLENSRGPNPDCSVCSSASIKVHVDFSKAKLRDVLDTVVTAPVDKGGAGMDLEDVAIMHGSRMIYDIDFDDNLDATIKDLGITEGTILRVSGDSNVQELDLILLGKESGDAVELKEKVPKLERRTRKRSLEEEEMPAGEPDAKKQRVEGNNNEIVIIDDDEGDNAGVISLD